MSNIFKHYVFGFRDSFHKGWIGNYQYIQWQLVLILSFWNLYGGNSQAAQVHQNWSSLPILLSNTKSIDFVLFQEQEIQEIKLIEQLNQAPILIAAPENFNPGLRVPPQLPKPPVIKPPEKPSPPPASKPRNPIKPLILEGIQTNFRNDTDNFGQHNLFIEPTLQWRSPNGNKIFLTTGFDLFEQRSVESVTNIPVKLGWQGKIGEATLHTTAGVDFFDRLPTAINFNAKVELPIVPPQVSSSGKLLSGVIISANVDHSPYKFNAQTLENQITAWRFGPDLYWQIDRYTSLFSSLRLGNYSDGNFEIQSFSRLERKFGQFSVAANLFNWSYSSNAESTSGYFSPPDFLVYNAEVAWEDNIADFLRCRLFATLGQQRLNGEFDNASGYGSRCTVKFSPALEADLNYSFSNVRNQNRGGSDYGSNSLTGQLRIKF
ncbi:hypothetical protein ACX27_13945 [Nostoc piscinale CENA21]|uniref:Cellulose synthase operon C C-terminal domain-containing protein n=1 Tax=Nostoc piscinale CENA21 TaxID=224013 RepID=A0A0M3V5C9_9NOSO|nr:hypothetical protein [Nostoc piscinale]ALF53693.1 hypothetical protein ACX27_13945 [Nostoc piscinale CENA21]